MGDTTSFVGSVLSKKKVAWWQSCHHVNWLVLLGLTVLTNTIHLVEFHWEFRIQLAYRQPFFYIGGPHPTEHGYQWVNDACQLNLFALPVCHQRHGELKLLHFFKRTTTTSLLTSYLWGFRGIGVARSWMNVRWVVVVVVVVVLLLGNVPWVKNHILLESRL